MGYAVCRQSSTVRRTSRGHGERLERLRRCLEEWNVKLAERTKDRVSSEDHLTIRMREHDKDTFPLSFIEISGSSNASRWMQSRGGKGVCQGIWKMVGSNKCNVKQSYQNCNLLFRGQLLRLNLLWVDMKGLIFWFKAIKLNVLFWNFAILILNRTRHW